MLVAMLCSETALSRGEFHKERLFIITRNKNDNMVCYDAHSREGKLDAKEPLGVYWIIPQKDNKVEKLSSLERSRAYGFDLVRSFGGDSADFKMKALPRKLRVKRIDEKWVALMTIDSVEAILTSAYVMAGSGIMPKVNGYVSTEWPSVTALR